MFGSSHLAASTGLIAFIGGLALGARLFATRAALQTRPLRAYAILEILIGAFGIASPWILDGTQWLYLTTWPSATPGGIGFTLYRLALVSATILLPTAMMGATVPAITRVFTVFQKSEAAAFGLPLGANTAGALFGTVAAGFFLLPRIGLQATLLLAGSLNLAVGLIALALSRAPRFRQPAAVGVEAAPLAAPHGLAHAAVRERRLAFAVAAITGACGLGLEIAWTRLLALVLGSTTYAFTLMLATYLLGLALGTLAASAVVSRIRTPSRALAWILLMFASSTWFGLAHANDLPAWFLDVYRRAGHHGPLAFLGHAGLAAAVMLVPAIASGAVLPIAARAFAFAGPASATAGRLYAVNTAAGILAVVLVTFVTVPIFSVRATMMGAVMLLSAGAAVLAIATRPGILRALPVVACAVAIAAVTAWKTPPWRPSLVATAVYRYADRYASMSRAEFEAVRDPDVSPVLFDEDGYVARVTVVGPRNDPSLLLDGKGASAGGDIPTEILLAQLPIMLHGAPRRVLVIGHGAGVTTGSVLVHPGVGEVVSIELERKVLECAPLFQSQDGGTAADPRLRLVENDGRNYLLATSETFDVICSQPSNPWVSGAAPLFTAEAYRIGAKRLTEGGVFCQWLQTYETSPDNLRVLMRTFAAEFAHVALFSSSIRGNVFLVGSGREIEVDRTRIEELGSGWVGVQMRRALVESPAVLLGLFCFRDEDLREFAGTGVRNTDDNAFIEYAMPFDLFTNRVDEIHAMLRHESRGLPGLVSWPSGASNDARAGDWASWAVSLSRAGRPGLAREAAEEAARLAR